MRWGRGGRDLLLVTAYADTWGCRTRDAHTKTVWAEITALVVSRMVYWGP